MDFTVIDDKKKVWYEKKSQTSVILEDIRNDLILDWTYHSNAIAGNTLSHPETRIVLEGMTIGNKALREHLEMINHRQAIFYGEEVVQQKMPLSEWEIKHIHQLLLKCIDDQNGGVYRQENVMITGTSYILPDHKLVAEQMEGLMKWYHKTAIHLHPIVRGAILHHQFVKIHPFLNSNGQVARLLLNLELMKEDYPPIVIKKENRLVYFNALDQKEDHELTHLIAQYVEQTLDFNLQMLS